MPHESNLLNGGVVSIEPTYWLSNRLGEKIEDITPLVTNGRVVMNQDATPMWTLTGSIIPHDFLKRLEDHLLVEVTMYYADGTSETEAMGHYWVTRVVPTYKPEGTFASFTAEDLSVAMIRNRTGAVVQIPAGATPYTTLVRDYASQIGISTSQLQIPDLPTTVQAAFTYEEGTSIYTMVNEFLSSVGLRHIYATRQGSFTSSFSGDLSAQEPVHIYTANSSGSLIDQYTGSMRNHPIIGDVVEDPDDSRIRNRVTVRRINPGNPTISYTANNTNPTSPTYIGGPMGVLAETVDDPQLADVAAAEAKAKELLQMGSSYFRRVRLAIVPDLRFNPYDVVQLDIRDEDDELLLDGKWWRRAVELPLGPPASALSGGMIIHLNRVEPVE